MDKNVLMMAVSAGQKSPEAAEIKRFIGFGVCKVLAVNPTAAEIQKYLGYTPNEEPQYVGYQEIEGKQIPYVRISFIVRTDPSVPENNGIETTQMLTLFVRKQYNKGATSGKYQVIDEYCREAWADEATIKSKSKIMYKEGTMEANISANYRPAYVGEYTLTDFIRVFLNIPNIRTFNSDTNEWYEKKGDDAKMCECRFDNIDTVFKGDIEEIKQAIAYQLDNKIKLLFGIRNNDSGRIYQDIYTGMFLRPNQTNYDRIVAEITDRKAHGGLSNRVYDFCTLKEYSVTPTDFSQNTEEEKPFEASNNEELPW